MAENQHGDMNMPDPSPSERPKPEMPHIAGVSAQIARELAESKPLRFTSLAAVLLVCLLAVVWLLRPTPSQAPVATPPPRIDLPPAATDLNLAMPHATVRNPGIATLDEMAKPWSSKDFSYTNRVTGETLPALLIRLPSGSASQPSSYWALAMNAPYGNCRLEYIMRINKLKTDYGFRDASHPMVGNPCSRTVFDPLKLSNLPGGVWARGGIVQGSDLRPPLGIEIKVQANEILAVRME